jgi:hypothetical protein
LYGHAVAGLVQGTRRGRPQGREREIAFLIKKGHAKADRVGAGKKDYIKIFENAQLLCHHPSIFERFDFDRRQTQRRRAIRFQKPAQRHRLEFRPGNKDVYSVQR